MYRAWTQPVYYRYFKVAYSQTKTDAEILQYASEYNLADNEYFFDRYESWWTTNNWFPMHVTKNVTNCELMSRHPPPKNDQLWNHEQASALKIWLFVKSWTSIPSKNATNCETVNRHPRSFNTILNFYRTGKLHVADEMCALAFKLVLMIYYLTWIYMDSCSFNSLQVYLFWGLLMCLKRKHPLHYRLRLIESVH